MASFSSDLGCEIELQGNRMHAMRPSLDVRVHPLDAHHQDAAMRLLARAFYDDPLMRFVMAESRSRAAYLEMLTELMNYSLAIREAFGWPTLGLWDDGVLSAVAALSLPEEKKGSEALNQRRAALFQRLGEKGASRLERYGEIAEGQRPDAPHVFLGVLGVDPSAQGRGFGKLLLDAVQGFSDTLPGSIGVFLDTENPDNVAFYKHCGYEVLSQHRLETIRIWSLFRRSESLESADP